MKLYDPQRKSLIFLGKKADAAHWDQLWTSQEIKKIVTGKKFDFVVSPATRRYLPVGSRVLEGGCGNGTYVYLLEKLGYHCVGVDYAKKTISAIHRAFPKLHVQVGDVRNLKSIEKNSFDGYWSIGVIEHFFNGYVDIIKEMKRVLKPGGYAFVTFPYMSPLRKIKARLDRYGRSAFQTEPPLFYQFALDDKSVIGACEKQGLSLVEKKPFDGFRGVKSELPLFNFLTMPIEKLAQTSVSGQALRFVLGRLFQPFASHCVLLVFRKRKN